MASATAGGESKHAPSESKCSDANKSVLDSLDSEEPINLEDFYKLHSLLGSESKWLRSCIQHNPVATRSMVLSSPSCAEGGQGTVYLAQVKDTGSFVALKKIDAQASRVSGACVVLISEARQLLHNIHTTPVHCPLSTVHRLL